MFKSSQQLRQQLSQHTSGWSREAILSAVIKNIADHYSIPFHKILKRHPWLKQKSHPSFEFTPSIAALGWAHQFTNDPKRHVIDRQIQETRKVTPEQMAPKTQIFTPEERAKQMVRVSLGTFCTSRGITPPFELECSLAEKPVDFSTKIDQVSILDPACGSGILLLTAANHLFELAKNQAFVEKKTFQPKVAMQQVLRKQIFGCDIDSEMTELTQISLSILALKHNVEPEEYNLHTTNSPWGALQKPAPLPILKSQNHDIVLCNPPYQNIRRISNSKQLKKWYPKSHMDLYSAFMERCIDWLKPDGLACMLTMHNWLFLKQMEKFRERMTSIADLRLVEQHKSSAFDGLNGEVTHSCLSLWRAGESSGKPSLGIDQEGQQHWFHTKQMEALPNKKLLFWFAPKQIKNYQNAIKLGSVAPARQGLATGNNTRFLRYVWEIEPSEIGRHPSDECAWLPYTKGAAGRAWFTPMQTVIQWRHQGWHKEKYSECYGSKGGNGFPNRQFYGQEGIAYAKIGHRFTAREILSPGVIGNAGSAIFPATNDIPNLLCLLNHPDSKAFLNSLNPSLNFTESDINALPIFNIPHARAIYETLTLEFKAFEQGNESSIDFRFPQPQRWQAAQQWANRILESKRFAPFEAAFKSPNLKEWCSYAIGVALGRFSKAEHGFFGETLITRAQPTGDDLDKPDFQQFLKLSKTSSEGLRRYLFGNYFQDLLKRYQRCPPIWPLGPKDKSFIIWLNPRTATAGIILKTINECLKGPLTNDGKVFLTELENLIVQGPCSTKEAPVEQRHGYEIHTNDGLLCQAAQIWPSFAFNWHTPYERWKKMATVEGRLSFAWSTIFSHYWPSRHARQLAVDPSIGQGPK